MAKRRYSGALGDPIKATVPDDGAMGILFPELTARGQRERKLPALARLYGLKDPRTDHAVAVQLLLYVCEEVGIPGFQIASRGRPKGTPRQWNVLRSALFVADVEATMKAKHCNAGDAIRRLKKLKAGSAVKSYMNRFIEARKRMRQMFPSFDDPKWRAVAIREMRAMADSFDSASY